MKISYKNDRIELAVFVTNCIVSAIVAASFIIMLGFKKRLLEQDILAIIQISAFIWFILDKIIRLLNARRKKLYIRAIWFEFPILTILIVVFLTSKYYSANFQPATVRITAIRLYLAIQLIDKISRTVVDLASTGKNPTKTLIISFIALILLGSGLLMLPKSHNTEQMSFVDALFTATSATCVTGLIVKDTGTEFSLAGQLIILAMIQLGGLGIMVFGAVFALLLRQAISVKESVAMQDVLSSETLSEIGTMIGFIFISTIIFEAIGAFAMHQMWNAAENTVPQITDHKIFASVFHSISAFCNAGFALSSESLINYNSTWQPYAVFCPLIILGGFGFGVLYDLILVSIEKAKSTLRNIFKSKTIIRTIPKRLSLQSKIVLTVSLILILTGTAMLLLFEKISGNTHFGPLDAFFQSVTARTAGFNTVDINSMSPPGKLILIILMFIGGSPGSTAGGIKTVTLCVIIMTVWAAIRKRNEVEIFKRSIKYVIVGRAITVALIFIAVLFTVTLMLVITERNNAFTMSDILFESASALGTVGLSTGITPSLTTAGKLIIIIAMLVGRLGPLTLLAGLTFNLKPYRYSYPDEALIVG